MKNLLTRCAMQFLCNSSTSITLQTSTHILWLEHAKTHSFTQKCVFSPSSFFLHLSYKLIHECAGALSVTMCYYGSHIIVLFVLLCDCFSTLQSQDSSLRWTLWFCDACVLKSMRLPLSVSLVIFLHLGLRCVVVVVAVLCVVFLFSFCIWSHAFAFSGATMRWYCLAVMRLGAGVSVSEWLMECSYA